MVTHSDACTALVQRTLPAHTLHPTPWYQQHVSCSFCMLGSDNLKHAPPLRSSAPCPAVLPVDRPAGEELFLCAHCTLTHSLYLQGSGPGLRGGSPVALH